MHSDFHEIYQNKHLSSNDDRFKMDFKIEKNSNNFWSFINSRIPKLSSVERL